MRKYLLLLLIPVAFGFRYLFLHMKEMTTDEFTMMIMVLTLFLMAIPIGAFVGEESEEVKPSFSNLTFNVSIYYIEPLLAFGLFISFFLPWIDMIFIKMNAYKILEAFLVNEPNLYFLYIALILPIVLIVTSFFRINLKQLSLITVLAPYFLLAWIISETETPKIDDLSHISFGFYLTLFFSLLLIIISLLKIFKEGELFKFTKVDISQLPSFKIPFYAISILLAIGLCISFFLPWVQLTIVPYSGYDLVTDEMVRELSVLLVPFSAIIAIVSIYERHYIVVPFIAGFLPFILLLVNASQNTNNIFKMLDYGGYITLFLAFTLILVTIIHAQSLNAVKLLEKKS